MPSVSGWPQIPRSVRRPVGGPVVSPAEIPRVTLRRNSRSSRTSVQPGPMAMANGLPTGTKPALATGSGNTPEAAPGGGLVDGGLDGGGVVGDAVPDGAVVGDGDDAAAGRARTAGTTWGRRRRGRSGDGGEGGGGAGAADEGGGRDQQPAPGDA